MQSNSWQSGKNSFFRGRGQGPDSRGYRGGGRGAGWNSCPPGLDPRSSSSGAQSGAASFDRSRRGAGRDPSSCRGFGPPRSERNRAAIGAPPESHCQPRLSLQLSTFCRNIHQNVLAGSKIALKGSDLNLWKGAFEAAASNQLTQYPEYVHSLLTVYRDLPDADSYAPSALDVVKSLDIFVNRISQPKDVQLIRDVITGRLRRSSSMKTIKDQQQYLQVFSVISTLEGKVIQALSRARSGNMTIIAINFKTEVSEYVQLIMKQMQKTDQKDSNNDDSVEDCFGWAENPTIGWLTSANWLKTTGLRSFYEDVDQYVSVVQNTWTLLTFYWAVAALWPKCHFKHVQASGSKGDDAQACGVPLLTRVENSADFQCTMRLRDGRNSRVCGGQASWRCLRHGHDAICEECLESKKEALAGPPDQFTASTDIYDAVSSSVTLQGDNILLSLKHCQSRKPPKVAVNWRTSYRLQPSCLVGVVNLPATGMAIKNDYLIYFGEIVKHDKQADDRVEYDRRAKGELAIRLLSRSDCATMKFDAEVPFKTNGTVAIIDMRVFVPEVVSVLSTLVNPSFKEGLARLSFSEKLLDYRRDSTPPIDYVGDSNDVQGRIAHSVENSTIPVIRDLPTDLKHLFVRKIVSIPAVTTLDETQATAFSLALSTDLHCTQGPPGTGKSYVGVALVLAFVELRSMLREIGKSVGPLVVLSYKNHALDEFLLDVLKETSRTTRQLGMNRPGALIRLGIPEKPELTNYTERSSSEETAEFRELQYRLEVVKSGRMQFHSLTSSISISGTLSSDAILCSLCVCYKVSEVANMTSESAFKLLRAIPRELMSMSSLRCIRDLLRQAEHWLSESNAPLAVSDVVSKWLGGERPPPRCQGFFQTEGEREPTQCMNYAAKWSPFCQSVHGCVVNDCPVLRFSSAVPYCQNHRCIATNDCANECLPTKTVCLIHACPVCVDKPKLGQQFACADHLCCVPGCPSFQLAPFKFCLHHCCRKCLESHSVTAESVRVPIWKQQYSDFCVSHKCAKEDCLSGTKKESGGGYCDVHSCTICGQQVDMSSKEACLSKLCPDHRCSYYDKNVCRKVRVISADGRQSLYCSKHTCAACVQLGLPLDRMIYKPRNTCDEHVLCQGIDKDSVYCCALVKAGQAFCPDHEEEQNFGDLGQCWGKTVRKTRCKTRKPPADNSRGKWYCRDHEKQRPNDGNDSVRKNVDIIRIDYSRVILNEVPARVDQQNEPNLILLLVTKCNIPDCNMYGLTDRVDMAWLCPLHVFLLSPPEGDVPMTVAAAVDEVSKSESNNEMVIEANNAHDVAVAQKEIAAKPAKVVPPKRKTFVEEDVCLADTGAASANPDEDELIASEVAESVDNALDSNEQAEHNREIYNDDADADAPNMDDIEEVERAISSKAGKIISPVIALEECQAWNWDMTAEERRKAAVLFIECCSSLLAEVISKAEDHVEEQRQRKAEANAMTLKNATVIGGTVVGAARRLMALRASEPFAIVVEEACEVMEPTLVAVLAVESVQKLELIGDHRQLPAFVSQCWFNLELSMKSIKTSLFERMVNGDSRKTESTRTCSVLNVQRRMRPCIADLTRGEYVDVTVIKDHKCTLTQKIGDRNVPVSSSSEWKRHADAEEKPSFPLQKDWVNHGRSVPGIRSAIFFWNMLNNESSRPKVGLSACNENEARAVVQLTRYLLLCGVPPPAISIITPYQGQRREIVDELRKHNCLPRRVEPGGPPNSVIVSTVDRYQGDENDVVILSLVRTQPGNRFVSLPNRFIVAASRARLGFYIIGSVEAVIKTSGGGDQGDVSASKHWLCFVNRLKKPDESGCDNGWEASRVGDKLPICCPFHATVFESVSSLKDYRNFPSAESWSTFCHEPCQHALQCGHPCRLPCHVRDKNLHEMSCKEALSRPCERHSDIPLLCGDIKLLPGETLQHGLAEWKCDVIGQYNFPDCPHSVELRCWKYDEIAKGKSLWPDCHQSVEDFIHPQCNHVFSGLECYKRRQYENQAPVCHRQEARQLSCGHQLKLECCQWNDSSFKRECKEAVNFARPRCHHVLSLQCKDSQKLQEWWEANHYVGVADDNVVKQGKKYGPPESTFTITNELPLWRPSRSIAPLCKVEILFEKSCGHFLKLPCSEAFELTTDPAAKIPPCTDDVTIQCPLCKSDLQVSCCISEKLADFQCGICAIDGDDGQRTINESDVRNLQLTAADERLMLLLAMKKSKLCSTKINVVRSCQVDHVESMACYKAVQVLLKLNDFSKCSKKTLRLLECGHGHEVTCCDRNKLPPPLCNHKADEPFIFPECRHVKNVATCHQLQALRLDPNRRCTQMLQLNFYRCGHSVEIACCDKQTVTDPEADGERFLPQHSARIVVDEDALYCKPLSSALICNAPVDFKRTCGHIVSDIPCHEAFAWADKNKPVPKCMADTVLTHPLCGHELPVPCWVRTEATEWKPWPEGEPVIHEVAEGLVLQYPFDRSPMLSPIAQQIKCPCRMLVLFVECGHTNEMNCHEAFMRPNLMCRELETRICQKPNCGASRNVTCYELRHSSQDQLDAGCSNVVFKLCPKCGINKQEVPCCEPFIQCEKKVEAQLPCGHVTTWQCGFDDDPRNFHDNESGQNIKCLGCILSLWEEDESKEVTGGALVTEAIDMIESELEDKDVIEQLQLRVSNDVDKFEETRKQLINALYSSMMQGEQPAFPPPSCNSLQEYIRNNYELVYVIAEPNQKVTLQRQLEIRNTNYGRGVPVKVFEKGAVQEAASRTGSVQVGVAMTFKGHVLNNVAPFRVGKGRKVNDNAERLARSYVKKGYSCVISRKDDASGKPLEYVYWCQGAIVPLFDATLQMRGQCAICLDYKTKNRENGAICNEKHFVCWTCISDHLEELKKVDAIDAADQAGNLCCQACEGKKGYDLLKIVPPTKIAEALIEFKLRTVVGKKVKAAREAEAENFRKELEALRNADEIARLRRQIIDDILTPKCPSCKRAFIDFDGCFAITCHCGDHFCAWCLALCPGDAHNHVATCKFAETKGMYGNLNDLKTVWNKIRKNQIRNLLQNQSAEVKKRLLQDMKTDFADIALNITLADL